MIIKSTLDQSSLHRRTHLEHPSAEALESVISTLLAQWNIVDHLSRAPSPSAYALLITLDGGERLIIDKQEEWTLFCSELGVTATSTSSELVCAELVTRESVLDRSGQHKHSVGASPLQASIAQIEADIRQLSSNLKSLQARLDHQDAPRASPSQPKQYAFHSVEPQAIGQNTRSFRQATSSSATQQGSQPGKGDSQESTDPAPLTLEEITRRSQLQGQSLNRFFGALQARSAGNPHSTQQHSEPAASTSTSAPTYPSSAEVHQEQAKADSTSVPDSKANSSTKNLQDVAQHNKQLNDLWQERLAQMGHKSQSGSTSTTMEPKAETTASAELDDAQELFTSQTSHAGNQAISNNTPIVTESEPIAPSPFGQDSGEGLGSNPAQHQAFPIRGMQTESESERSQQMNVAMASRSTARSEENQDTMEEQTSYFTDGPSKRSFMTRPSMFLRRRGLSDTFFTARASRSALHTPNDGTMTPRSLNSSIFRRGRRRLSMSNMSDALKRWTPEQDRSYSQKVAEPVNSTPLTGGASQSGACPPVDQQAAGDSMATDHSLDAKRERYGRPSLLRATQRTPSSSATAVNLSSAGGIALHISSVGPSNFVKTGDVKAVSRRQSDSYALDAETCHGQDAPIAPARNLFDIMLPREIRINCLRALIELHKEDSSDRARNGNAEVSAIRELMRLSCVSRSWQSLIFDGQLWQTFDASSARGISDDCLLRVAHEAGPFIKHLNLSNMQNLSSSVFMKMTMPTRTQPANGAAPKKARSRAAMGRARTLTLASMSMSTISLPSLNRLSLQGCRNLSTQALHHALARLPHLQHLNISNLPSVTNNTCYLLGATLPHLRSLNINRCVNVSGDGVTAFIEAAQGCLYDAALSNGYSLLVEASMQGLQLQELRAVGLCDTDETMMGLLGKSLRNLRILDLSYAMDLTDDGIAAFTHHFGPSIYGEGLRMDYGQAKQRYESPDGPFVVLSQRQAGGSAMLDSPHYRRLHPSLTHLTLSSCRGLTDRTGVNLAYAVPALKTLELANIGNSLHDDGLVKLLESTPHIERIDVEGATELTDLFLQTITPPLDYLEHLKLERTSSPDTIRGGDQSEARANNSLSAWKRDIPTGAYLSHLIVSHLSRLSSDALLTLVRSCPRLMHLQVDDTRANDDVLSEFVSLQRQRRRKGAYISLVDCRSLSKSASTEVFSGRQARPRDGKVGPQYVGFHYEGSEAAKTSKATEASSAPVSAPASPPTALLEVATGEGSSSSHGQVVNPSSLTGECDDRLIVVKTFWAWQAVDVRQRLRRRMEAKRRMAMQGDKHGARDTHGRRRRGDSLVSALTFLSSVTQGLGGEHAAEDDGQGRWSRIASGLIGPGDEGEDARMCTIM